MNLNYQSQIFIENRILLRPVSNKTKIRYQKLYRKNHSGNVFSNIYCKPYLIINSEKNRVLLIFSICVSKKSIISRTRCGFVFTGVKAI